MRYKGKAINEKRKTIPAQFPGAHTLTPAFWSLFALVYTKIVTTTTKIIGAKSIRSNLNINNYL